MIKRFAGIIVPVFIAITAATGFHGLCQAQTAYVSDMLVLTFRQGPGNDYPVIARLKSDTPLTVLGQEEKDFMKVELASGEQGWVNKNFVVTQLPKAFIIEQLKKENQTLKDRIDDLMEAASQDQTSDTDTQAATDTQTAIDEADRQRKANETLKNQNDALSKKLTHLNNQYTTLKNASEEVSKTIEENKKLKAENTRLSNAVAEQRNSAAGILNNTAMIKWVLTGVGVLLLGWIIGHSVSSRRKSSGSFLD